MKDKISEKEWLEEFKEFVNSGEGVEVPTALSDQVLQYVHKSLNPSPWIVFSKLLGIHAVVGTLSLAVCDQFGLNPFNSGFSLSEYFMKFGHSVCMLLCGFLFISLTLVLGRLILPPEEIKIFKENVFVQIPILSALSLGAFMIFGAEVVLSIGLLWLLGAIVGGLVTARVIAPKMHLA